MKTTLLGFLLVATPLVAIAEDPSLAPLKAIEQFGSISLTDGSSVFTFSKDGSFQSGPLGMSGRKLEGQWTADDSRFTAIAKLGWLNGLSSGHDYCRIVFVIYPVRKRLPQSESPIGRRGLQLFDGYFLIDEMVRIPEPTPSPK